MSDAGFALGLDVGARTTKAAIVSGGKIAAISTVPTGFDVETSAQQAIELVLKKASISQADVQTRMVTGVGKKRVSEVLKIPEASEVASMVSGVFFFSQAADMIIDAGAEAIRAVSLDVEGKMRDYAVNDKCAAGAGTFVESMALALELSLDDFSRLALESSAEIPVNAQCVVFAESEAVSLIHEGTPAKDVAKALNDAIAERASAVVARVQTGKEKNIVLIGGMGRNTAFLKGLEKKLKIDHILVPDEGEYISAVGAAVLSRKGV